MRKLLFILLFVPFALFGQENYSLSFDGVDDYVEFNNININENEFTELTIMFRILWRGHTGSEYQGLVSKINGPQSGFGMQLSALNSYYELGFGVGSGYVNVTGGIPIENQWQHIAGVYNGDELELFVDGESVGTTEHINGIIYNNLPLKLGANSNFSEYLNGNIGELSIWEIALTQEEIQSYINCPPTGNEDGIVGSWDFNNVSGNTIFDLSENGNHGFIDGATYSEDVPELNCNLISGNEVSFEVQLNIEQILDNGFTSGVIYNDSYYFVSNFSTTWTNSDSICNSLGGNLLVIETMEENQFIIDNLNLSDTHSPGLWIGLRQNFNSLIYSEPNGGWEWVNGVQLTFNENNESWNIYQNWDIGQPNNVNIVEDSEEYANIWFQSQDGNDGTWNDWTNTTTESSSGLYFILEVKFGCTDSTATNYNPLATLDDGSCFQAIYGCSDSSYIEFNSEVNVDDGSCDTLLSEVISQLTLENINLSNNLEQATTSISSLQQALDTWNTTIDLSAGWNMFGYGCPTSIDVADGLSNHTESIIITKDNNGNVYMPEFGFNGIGDFTPGFGYQIKLTEAIEGFSLCDWYVNDIPEDNIVSLQEENADLNQQIKCLTNPEIGDFCYGGIIFYMDSLSQNGFVAATQDLINNVDPVANGVPEGFEWGCYGIDIETSSTIGSGYSNTLSIVNQNCQTQNGGLSAAEAALNYEDNEYSDWYLPSKDELLEIYNKIGPESENMNLGIFETEFYPAYWSSSSADGSIVNIDEYAQEVSFADGITTNNFRNSSFRVRPIRAFGFILGCMDETACNFSANANMADGSCEYSEQGYDCEGNITAQIGDVMEGGYLFYIDSTGQHGLVAATEDIGPFEWGCYETELSGSDGTSIGAGNQNTLDIVTGCAESPIAASEALAYVSNGYDDWYLPSKDELTEMCYSIGQGLQNIGGFSSSYYYSSSERDNIGAWDVSFFGCNTGGTNKHTTLRVRPIRSF